MNNQTFSLFLIDSGLEVRDKNVCINWYFN